MARSRPDRGGGRQSALPTPMPPPQRRCRDRSRSPGFPMRPVTLSVPVETARWPAVMVAMRPVAVVAGRRGDEGAGLDQRGQAGPRGAGVRHDRLAGRHNVKLEARRDAAALEHRRSGPQVLEPAGGTGAEIAGLDLEPGMVREIGGGGRVGRHHDDGGEIGEIDLVQRGVAGVLVARLRLEGPGHVVAGVVERKPVGIADRGERAGEHGKPGDGLAPFQRDVAERRAAQLQHLKAAGAGGRARAPDGGTRRAPSRRARAGR